VSHWPLRVTVSVALVLGAAIGGRAQEKALTLYRSIPLPELHDGDFDHFAVDLRGNRLFLAAEENSAIEVFDLSTDKLIHIIRGTKAPHAMLYREDLKKLFVVDGDLAQCRIFDSDSYEPLGTIGLRQDADSIVYDPATKYLYIVNGGREAHLPHEFITIVDTSSDQKLGEIRVDSDHVEAMVIEKSSPRLFVSISGRNAIGVIDRVKRSLTDIWLIAEQGNLNVPLALDEAHHRLFTVARKPEGRLIVLDTNTGKVVASAPCVGLADDLSYDELTHRVYVAGDGFLDVFRQSDPDRYELIDRIATGFRAKTGILVGERNRYYLAVPHHESKTAELRVYEVLP
jgi:DNA-binding beta-propeller fold protein YncE